MSDHPFFAKVGNPKETKGHAPKAETYLGPGGGYRCETCHYRLKVLKGGRSANPYQHTPYKAEGGMGSRY